MATSTLLKFSFILMFPFFLFLSLTSSSTSTPSSSLTVASRQHKFWSRHVRNNMPNAILSKLTPLSVHDSDYFTSLVSNEQSFVSDAKFCTLANLACAANLDNVGINDRINNAKIGFNQAKVYITESIASNHLARVDPFSFFRLSVLAEGKRVHLPDLQDTSPSRAFLPSQIASKISLSSNELRRVFPESFVSPLTNEAIQMTLLYCHAPTLKGEIKSCPKSLEEMIQFSKNALGQKLLLALTSKSTDGSGKELIVGSIKKYDATTKMVSCHEVFLPFATYYCHLLSSTHLYAVDLLEPETRVPVNTVLAVCHFDTSAWSENHVAFKLLKLSPGKVEAICHWFSQSELAWIGASA